MDNVISSIFPGIGPVIVLISIVVNIILSIAVYSDVLTNSRRGKNTKLLPGVLWFIVVLATGVPGAALYWFVCNFSRDDDRKPLK